MLWRAPLRAMRATSIPANDLIKFSSISAAANALRQQKEIASVLEPDSKDFLMFSACYRLMNNEFFKPDPDTASLTYILDRYIESEALPIATNDQQLVDLYMRFRLLATRTQDKFELKDWITVIWRLQQARISMDKITMYDLCDRLASSSSPLSAEAILRVVESFATQKVVSMELLYDSLLPAFAEAEKSQEQVLRMLICLCIFGNFGNNRTWRSLLTALFPLRSLTYSSLHKLNMLKYVLSIECPHLLLERINNKITIRSLLTPSQSLIPPSSVTDPSRLPMSQFSQLHEAIKHVILYHPDTKNFTENFNIDNGFLVDFAEERTKTCIDVDNAFHFYRPMLGSSYFELENILLNGFTVMKYKTLVKAGWRVVQIPFYEWEEFAGGKEKEIYLSRKLQSRRPLSLPNILPLR